MRHTYFDQNLHEELLCEICKEVCNDPQINAETGLIYCYECSTQNGLLLKGLISQTLRSIYYKCQECFRYKKYLKFRVHQNKCLKYYQNQQKGQERFDVLGQTPEIKLSTQLMVETVLNQKFDYQKLIEAIKDPNYKIFCKIDDCHKELHISQVKNHFKNCEFQQKSCNNCELWQGTYAEYLIHILLIQIIRLMNWIFKWINKKQKRGSQQKIQLNFKISYSFYSKGKLKMKINEIYGFLFYNISFIIFITILQYNILNTFC
ncbi:hypothetical protein pb186bvf_003120 [Paramecium bursaria]